MIFLFRLIEHPDYDPYGRRGPMLDYDYALIKLDRDAIGVKTLPVCLSNVTDHSFPNEMIFVSAGWGLDRSGNISPVLNKVKIFGEML